MATAAKLAKVETAGQVSPVTIEDVSRVGMIVEWTDAESPREISPALKSWLKNCIVPILVREYIANQQIQVESASDKVVERDSASAVRMGQ